MSIDNILRSASVAQIGGFRPPETHLASWFGGQGVALPGEELPTYKGDKMFPLLQVRIDELPVIPEILKDTAMLVVFMNKETLPYDSMNGDGFLVREHKTLEGLQPIPDGDANTIIKKFPIKWGQVENDAPTWDDLLYMEQHDPNLEEGYHDRFTTHEGTKFGGYPLTIQAATWNKGYVFQIDSEYDAGWSWADNGVGYFFKNNDWYLDWQCL